MKKINLLSGFVFLILLLSCNGKTGNKSAGENETEKSEIENTCDFSEIEGEIPNMETGMFGDDDVVKFYPVKRKGKLYTGVCIEKDQNDSILKKAEIRNGYLIHNLIRKKFNNKYIVIEDMNYDNLKPKDGKYYPMIGEYQLNGKPYNYTGTYGEYKNGQLYNFWNIGISLSPSNYVIHAVYDNKNGKEFHFDAENMPKYFEGATIGGRNELTFTNDDISFDEMLELIKSIREGKDFPGFMIWEPNNK